MSTVSMPFSPPPSAGVVARLGILGAFSVIGGGRFLPAGAGATRRETTGSDSEGLTGDLAATSSCRALKLRFLRTNPTAADMMIVEGGVRSEIDRQSARQGR